MPSQAHFRRDPQQGKKGFSKNKGFTVIELMIVVAVVAIIASLALPSYRTLIEKRQVTSGAEQIGAFVSSAQMEAVKRGEPLTVYYDRNSSSDWCFGFNLAADPACDCTAAAGADGACEIGGAYHALRSAQLGYPDVLNSVSQGDSGSFGFDPVRGLLTDPSYNVDFELLSDNQTYALHVQVNGTGRMKICSGTDKKVPGYDDC